ncbi:hypothetical protein BGX33_001801 [Mortierella sp. NVP41]|nr:hypothetical protein BGX33_001801 [Mortierella sp. NVP41]
MQLHDFGMPSWELQELSFVVTPEVFGALCIPLMVTTGAEGSITGHETCVEDVVCSPDGRLLGSIGNEGIVRLWNAETGEPSTSLDTVILGAACCIQFSPNSQQFAVGGRDKILRLWDLQTGEPSHSFIGHTHAFFCVTYSPAGDQLASGSSDHTARLWNPTTGESGPVLTGHIGTVSSLSYSPDGAILASCSFDSTVRLWDPTSGRCLGVIRDFFGLIAPVAWKATSEGRFFATGSDDSFVRVWQLIEDGDDDGSEGEIEEGGVGGEGGEGGVEYRVRLHWSSGCDGLAVSDANVQGVVGLSTTNLALLKQRGAIGDPILNN